MGGPLFLGNNTTKNHDFQLIPPHKKGLYSQNAVQTFFSADFYFYPFNPLSTNMGKAYKIRIAGNNRL